VSGVHFILRCLPNTNNPHKPEGYLFVCPAEDFPTGLNSFQWPDCPAYWSLDPSGAARLSTEDANTRGFPVLRIQTQVYGYSWDDSVYDGLRRFHRGKGFDPDSQDVATHLGYPLCKLRSVVTSLPYSEPEVNIISPWLTYLKFDGEVCNHNENALCQALGHYL
jgi:hypothetical protein